jgi:hypothetical protein
LQFRRLQELEVGNLKSCDHGLYSRKKVVCPAKETGFVVVETGMMEECEIIARAVSMAQRSVGVVIFNHRLRGFHRFF